MSDKTTGLLRYASAFNGIGSVEVYMQNGIAGITNKNNESKAGKSKIVKNQKSNKSNQQKKKQGRPRGTEVRHALLSAFDPTPAFVQDDSSYGAARAIGVRDARHPDEPPTIDADLGDIARRIGDGSTARPDVLFARIFPDPMAMTRYRCGERAVAADGCKNQRFMQLVRFMSAVRPPFVCMYGPANITTRGGNEGSGDPFGRDFMTMLAVLRTVGYCASWRTFTRGQLGDSSNDATLVILARPDEDVEQALGVSRSNPPCPYAYDIALRGTLSRAIPLQIPRVSNFAARRRMARRVGAGVGATLHLGADPLALGSWDESAMRPNPAAVYRTWNTDDFPGWYDGVTDDPTRTGVTHVGALDSTGCVVMLTAALARPSVHDVDTLGDCLLPDEEVSGSLRLQTPEEWDAGRAWAYDVGPDGGRTRSLLSPDGHRVVNHCFPDRLDLAARKFTRADLRDEYVPGAHVVEAPIENVKSDGTRVARADGSRGWPRRLAEDEKDMAYGLPAGYTALSPVTTGPDGAPAEPRWTDRVRRASMRASCPSYHAIQNIAAQAASELAGQ